jgi:gluconate 2-dehydrogenase gamma chain
MSDPNQNGKGKGVPRRVALKVIGAMPAAMAVTGLEAATAPPATKAAAAAAKKVFKPKFFTDHEWKTAGVLADMIIPRDDRSGSATEAGVLEFMDEWVDYWGERIQAQVRGGLAWLDAETTRRFDKRFVELTDAQRRQVLDTIAYPPRDPNVRLAFEPTTQRQEAGASSTYPQGPPPQKPPEGAPPAQSASPEDGTSLSQGVAFFTLFRDLTASGFFTSEIGIKDIGFMGNQPWDWKGCPPEVLKKLGLACRQPGRARARSARDALAQYPLHPERADQQRHQHRGHHEQRRQELADGAQRARRGDAAVVFQVLRLALRHVLRLHRRRMISSPSPHIPGGAACSPPPRT